MTRDEVVGMLAEQRATGTIGISFLQPEDGRDLHVASLHCQRTGDTWLAALLIGGDMGIRQNVKTRTFEEAEATRIFNETIDLIFEASDMGGTGCAMLKVVRADPGQATWIQVPKSALLGMKGGQA